MYHDWLALLGDNLKPSKTRVIIIGQGFAGLNAAKTLLHSSAYKNALEILIFDKRNYHLFQPLLYQVATAALSPAEITTPIRFIFRDHEQVQIFLSEVLAIDADQQMITTTVGEYSYDYLILAAGAEIGYFGKEEWKSFAPGLKTLPLSLEIRRQILLAYEEAEMRPPHTPPTFVVVGGGPTGVEMAGAIAEISRFTLQKEFRKFKPQATKVLLVEAGERLLPSFSKRSSKRAQLDLENLCVEVLLGKKVSAIDGNNTLQLQSTIASTASTIICASVIIWSAGVRACKLTEKIKSQHAIKLDRSYRIPVQEDLSVANYPKLFAIGDLANSKGLPGIAPVALQQGKWCAKNILCDLAGKARLPFTYFDKGQLATVGRRRAVMEYRGFQSAGVVAWLIWIFVHIYYLMGMQNRFLVLMKWAWAYVNFKRSSRLIIEHGSTRR
ncbi:MAG: NAD(P)/FAD-dependent oxidoreductase [Oligoflexia bacterium]|nr:NAD(P)/FAD-dependent oxidoreductase [Oligoflexia bacterium]MBF0364945.1 NAD(P)/FAD-dependent oxidoreductase [Oligoflexia bacterium]